MNRKILTLAVATALVAPVASHADVKVSGLIQAEAASWEPADGKKDAAVYRNKQAFETDNRSTFTNDSLGTIFNEGPNHIRFDLDEKLSNTLKAEARYDMAFNTSGNFGSDSLIGEQAWIGLKGSNFHFRYGTLEGAYKSSRAEIEPWAFTSLQATGTGGGMSGGAYNQVYRVVDPSTATELTGGTALPEPQDRYKYVVNSGAAARGGDMGLTNEGFVEGALELGVNYGGFSARLQGIVDDASAMDGAGLLEFKYTMPNKFSVWLAASYTDLKDATNPITDAVDDATDKISETIDDIADKVGEDATDFTDTVREETTTKLDDGLGNWKVGGVFNLGPMVKLGLQYEDAEMGTLDNNLDGGKYILGSLDFTKGNISFGGWVAGYLSDIKDANKIDGPDGKLMDEDALSWSLGAKYHFGKRTHVYGGYRQTDSDNDYRDENLFTLGIRHTF